MYLPTFPPKCAARALCLEDEEVTELPTYSPTEDEDELSLEDEDDDELDIS